MTLRAKFRVDSMIEHKPHHQVPTSGWTEVSLAAQYSNSKEDNQFSAATPTGSLKMTVTTETGKSFFEVGKNYYLDFTEASS